MQKRTHYPRFLDARVKESLTDTPVVLINGPRQSGKTTLAREIGDKRGYMYISFDDPRTRDFAQDDPVGFGESLPEKVILDEVQHVPEFFRTIKFLVDRDRVPGRFILTGSANVLLVPKLGDSLAGRISIKTLLPLSRAEIEGRESGFLARLRSGEFRVERYERLGPRLAEMIADGGYPEALARARPHRREEWLNDYVDTIAKKDVRDFTHIRQLETIPKLLRVISASTATTLNVSKLSAPFEVSRTTIREHLTLLTGLFLVDELPPWFGNLVSRRVKSPKLHIGDTGIASMLTNFDSQLTVLNREFYGQLLETFVYQELRRQATWQDPRVEISHLRDRDGSEVDLVIEFAHNRVAGVEVKSAGTVNAKDFRGLRKLRTSAEDSFVAGVVLYDGEYVREFEDRMFALPIQSLWKMS
ncbi:MAG: ATP-binding protein [Actinobacteria bacterium]|nr:ATP-binding protein [Actinomycetota bacterium]